MNQVDSDYISVTLEEINNTLGFRITSEMHESLDIGIGDIVHLKITQIIKDRKPLESVAFKKVKKVNKSGGAMGSITFRKKFIENQGFEDGMELNIVFEKIIKVEK